MEQDPLKPFWALKIPVRGESEWRGGLVIGVVLFFEILVKPAKVLSFPR